MNEKWTPGPWIFYADTPSTDPNWHIITTANKMRIVANIHIDAGNVMDVSNARLIAAAPDLAEVVKVFIAETVDYMTRNNLGDPEQQHNVKWGRAVLARARGE